MRRTVIDTYKAILRSYYEVGEIPIVGPALCTVLALSAYAVVLLILLIPVRCFAEDVQIARLSPAMVGGGVPAAPAGIAQVGSATSATKAHNYDSLVTGNRTLGTGSNRLLVACVISNDDDDISSVTFDAGGANETAMTQFNHSNAMGTAAIFYKAGAPSGATGTFTVIQQSQEWAGHIVVTEWTGVDQTTPLENWNYATAESATPSVAITSETGAVVIDVLITGSAAATVHESQTQIYNQDSTTGTVLCGVSKEAGAASVTMSWSISSTYWGLGGCSINPAS